MRIRHFGSSSAKRRPTSQDRLVREAKIDFLYPSRRRQIGVEQHYESFEAWFEVFRAQNHAVWKGLGMQHPADSRAFIGSAGGPRPSGSRFPGRRAPGASRLARLVRDEPFGRAWPSSPRASLRRLRGRQSAQPLANARGL